jgi:asparagine synthase (glutamine-hydrolysing)
LRQAEDHLLAAAGRENVLASVARLETRQYLGGQLLRDIDAMSMAHSLEVRVPFVDHELLAAAWPALSRHHRLMENKRVLYETLEQPIPRACHDRPKQGFLFPFEQWMRGPLGEAVRAGLVEVRDRGWIAASAPDFIWHEWHQGRSHWSRPWALGILGHFLREADAGVKVPADLGSLAGARSA